MNRQINSGGLINPGLGFGYQTYELDDGTGTGFDGEAITSTLGFLHVMFDT